jgi:hypothetical protein
MAEVTLLWFACSNPDCNHVPTMKKKDKVKFWKDGQSVQREARRRVFLRYAEGHYNYENNGQTIIFNSKYGKLVMFDNSENPKNVHDFYNPIEGKLMCDVCQQRIINDGAMFQ